jgi:hypothetical protein
MANHAKEKLLYPAIGLIVVAVINGLLSLLIVVSFLVRFSSGQLEPGAGSPAFRAGYYSGQLAVLLIALATLAVAPLILKGAIDMLRVRNYRMAKAAAVLTIVPVTALCCLIGVPVSIWALVTLKKPEIRTLFQELPKSAAPGCTSGDPRAQG